MSSRDELIVRADHDTAHEALQAALVGRRIVSAQKSADNEFKGQLVLDDGTVIELEGNDGGCACNAGCYPLESVAAVDNVITSVEVFANPRGDWDDDSDTDGVYRIFVFADNEKINVAEFSGTDGNGYYGTGFSLVIRRASGSEVPS